MIGPETSVQRASQVHHPVKARVLRNGVFEVYPLHRPKALIIENPQTNIGYVRIIKNTLVA